MYEIYVILTLKYFVHYEMHVSNDESYDSNDLKQLIYVKTTKSEINYSFTKLIWTVFSKHKKMHKNALINLQDYKVFCLKAARTIITKQRT